MLQATLSLLRSLALYLFLSIPTIATPIEAPGVEQYKITQNDWPWWRGPHRDGHAFNQNVPVEWSEDRNIAWKTPIPGRGHGSPIVIGDSIFLATADESSQTQFVLGYDRANGKRLWTSQVHQGDWQGRIHKRNTQASSTLASDGERLFSVFMRDAAIWLTALSLDGELLWQVKASDFVSHWGYSTSPVLYDDLIIVASDHKGGGNLTAFDRASGEKRWNVERPAIPNYASPVVYRIDGRDQLVLPGCELMASYDPKTGIELWKTEATTQETVGSAVAHKNLVFASGGYPKNETACVVADGSGKVLWTSPIRVYAPSMLVHDGYLYTVADTGLAHCWNAETGDLEWRDKVKGDFSSSLVRVGDNLYASSEQGTTYVLKASPEKFELIAQNQLGSEIWSTPAICGERIYLRVAHGEAEAETRQEYLYAIGQ